MILPIETVLLLKILLFDNRNVDLNEYYTPKPEFKNNIIQFKKKK